MPSLPSSILHLQPLFLSSSPSTSNLLIHRPRLPLSSRSSSSAHSKSVTNTSSPNSHSIHQFDDNSPLLPEITQVDAEIPAAKPVYSPGFMDDLFLSLFRKKMAEETRWDSEKPGYDGLIEVANRLMAGRSSSETSDAAVRVLRSLFPPFLLDLYRILITPIGGGRLASIMVARVTAITCQWLMGPCKVNSVDLPDGSSCESGVFVERCKYLEESKCVGICINTCKIPTQTFFKDYMGIPLLMEPKFSDYSCQFKFGILPPPQEGDSAFNEPCLEVCPTAARAKGSSKQNVQSRCPKS